MIAKYKIIIYWSEDDQSYIAEVPELPGCMADGSSYQEAVDNAERVVAEWIETAKEQGRRVPKPMRDHCMFRLYWRCCSMANKYPLRVVFCIMLIVFGFYFINFHNDFSDANTDWGTFGDYVGGILNPIIAAFAFYLIAKTYALQKTELEATRSLLEISTDAQKNQIKLAALTALLNSNLTRIGVLESEKASLLKDEVVPRLKINDNRETDGTPEFINARQNTVNSYRDENQVAKENRLNEIHFEINIISQKNKDFEKQIEAFLKEKTE